MLVLETIKTHPRFNEPAVQIFSGTFTDNETLIFTHTSSRANSHFVHDSFAVGGEA